MDIVIVGTGMSALLLAKSLLARDGVDRLRMIGPQRPSEPHILSYWSDGPTPFDDDAVASWSTIAVVDAEGTQIRAPLARNAYRSIRAQRWVDRVTAEMGAQLEIIDAEVETIDGGPDAARLVAGGEELHADWVFASHALAAEPDCWQRFLGWEVLVPEGTLEPDTARLLDFRTPANGDFRFIYALPLEPSRVFLEHVSYAPCDHEASLEAYLRDVLSVTQWEVVDREEGQTPIFRDPPVRSDQRVLRIGVAAGLAKAATGYAITRMWRDAERIAEALLTRGSPHGKTSRGFLYRLADHFFVDLLRSEPRQIADLLSTLFSRAPADSVLEFLDERARWRDRLRVAVAVPGWPRWLLKGRPS